jgi:cytochrome c553
MSKRLFPTVCGAAVVIALVAMPANAADDIEAKQQGCNLCHGQNGAPTSPTVPIIWGQQSNYLYKELHDYHSGDRDSLIMSLVAKTIALEDLRKLADYFAAKNWPAPAQPAAAAATAPESSGMCRACHGQNFEGAAPGPRLAGLSYDYLIGAMNGFAHGERTNNLDMPKFMRDLSDGQRDAIAHYLAGL